MENLRHAKFRAAQAERNKASGNRPGGGRDDPSRPQLDLTKIKFPVLAINGEFDRPNAKTHRMKRELPNFTSVVLPGKSHLTAIAAPYMPKEYLESVVEFVNANDPKEWKRRSREHPEFRRRGILPRVFLWHFASGHRWDPWPRRKETRFLKETGFLVTTSHDLSSDGRTHFLPLRKCLSNQSARMATSFSWSGQPCAFPGRRTS